MEGASRGGRADEGLVRVVWVVVACAQGPGQRPLLRPPRFPSPCTAAALGHVAGVTDLPAHHHHTQQGSTAAAFSAGWQQLLQHPLFHLHHLLLLLLLLLYSVFKACDEWLAHQEWTKRKERREIRHKQAASSSSFQVRREGGRAGGKERRGRRGKSHFTHAISRPPLLTHCNQQGIARCALASSLLPLLLLFLLKYIPSVVAAPGGEEGGGGGTEAAAVFGTLAIAGAAKVKREGGREGGGGKGGNRDDRSLIVPTRVCGDEDDPTSR